MPNLPAVRQVRKRFRFEVLFIPFSKLFQNIYLFQFANQLSLKEFFMFYPLTISYRLNNHRFDIAKLLHLFRQNIVLCLSRVFQFPPSEPACSYFGFSFFALHITSQYTYCLYLDSSDC